MGYKGTDTEEIMKKSNTKTEKCERGKQDG